MSKISGGSKEKSGNMEALKYFAQNFRCSIVCRIDYRVLSDVLKSCAALSEIRTGTVLHGCVVKLGYFSCQAVSKSLLNMYAKCGAMGDCNKLFRQIENGDPVLWNIVLSGSAKFHAYDAETMRCFKAMHLIGRPKPTSVTFAIVFPVCARLGYLCAGKTLHSYIIKSGLETDTLVGNAMVSMYAKCESVVYDGYTAFDSIKDKDVVSWNAIIAGFSENKMTEDAFRLFCLMLRGPIEPNYATIANIMPVCAALPKSVSFHFGREIHSYVMHRSELQADVFVCNALVSFYLRIGRMEEAALIFRRMDSKDLVSWNAVIAGYASNGECLKALELFGELVNAEKMSPDPVTFLSILPVCAQLKSWLAGKQIHGYLFRCSRFYTETSIGNALVNFYTKCGDAKAAYSAFCMIFLKDLISWNSILDAFSEGPCSTQFLNLLQQMLKEGVIPDSVTILTITRFCATSSRLDKVKETHGYSIKTCLLSDDAEPTVGNALLDAYAKCGNVEYASRIFQGLSGKRSVVTYNSMISEYVKRRSQDDAQMLFNEMPATDLTTWNLMVRVYAENSLPEEALYLFREIQVQGMKPDVVTIMSLLPVCSQMASLHLLRQCHAYVTRAGLNDVSLNGSLLDLYAKCGCLKSSYLIYQSDPQKDLVTFTAMIGGFAMHGMGKEALMVYSQMLELGVKPDHVIITSLLSACSHSGLVDEGLQLFYSMENFHRMKPTKEQYGCVVDLLARKGRINDAYSLVNKMDVEVNANVWGSLLAACKIYDELDLGRVVADRLLEAKSDNIGNCILMSNIFAADARWDSVMEMRKLMKSRDLKKPAGCSWVEVEGKRNAFIAGDSSHPQRTDIFYALCSLYLQIRESLQFK